MATQLLSVTLRTSNLVRTVSSVVVVSERERKIRAHVRRSSGRSHRRNESFSLSAMKRTNEKKDLRRSLRHRKNGRVRTSSSTSTKSNKSSLSSSSSATSRELISVSLRVGGKPVRVSNARWLSRSSPHGNCDFVLWSFSAVWSETDRTRLSGTWIPIRWRPEMDDSAITEQPFKLTLRTMIESQNKDPEPPASPKETEKIVGESSTIGETMGTCQAPLSGTYTGTFWTGETPKNCGNPEALETVSDLVVKLIMPRWGERGVVTGRVDSSASVPALSGGCLLGYIDPASRRLRCQVFECIENGSDNEETG